MDRPILLLEKDDDSKWRVTEEAEQQLQSIDNLVGVISIAGNYNRGKSFLLNHLLGLQSNGFNVGKSRNATTKGIWMYALPNKKDPRKWLVALDSEGLDDVMTGDQDYDREIFVLILLLSHCFMYNISGAVGTGLIEALRLVSGLTHRIKCKEQADDSDPLTYFGQHFPHLFVILRDVHQELTDESNELETPDQYFERILALRQGEDEKTKNYNAPRISIRNFFSDRNCYSLPLPCDSKQMRHLDSLQTDELSDDFKNDLERIRDAVTTVAQTKAAEKGVIGNAFLEIIKQYIQMINDGKIPCIGTAHSIAAKEMCVKAKENSHARYKEEMNSYLNPEKPILANELAEFHETCRKKSFDEYNRKAWYGKGEAERIRLEIAIAQTLKEYREFNGQKWRQLCNRELASYFSELIRDHSKKKFTNDGCLKLFIEAKESAIAKYNDRQDLGPYKKDELNCYLQSHIDGIESSIKMKQEGFASGTEWMVAKASATAIAAKDLGMDGIAKVTSALKGSKTDDEITVINKTICANFEETVIDMKKETQVHHERDDKAMERNSKAHEREENNLRKSGHHGLADAQASARQQIESDRKKEKQALAEKMSWFGELMKLLRGKPSKLIETIINWMQSRD